MPRAWSIARRLTSEARTPDEIREAVYLFTGDVAAKQTFAYESQAATFEDAEPITDIADRLGWVVISMQHDWETIFAAA